MIRVCLTESEIKICNYVGRYRHHITKQNATDRMLDESIDKEEAAIRGVITEYAVSKYLNLHFDFNCDFRDFGADLVSHTGRTIEVKSTTTQYGNLNANSWSGNKPCDVFVLTEIHPTHVAIVGWIDGKKFLSNENKRIGKKDKPFFSVPQSKLVALNELNDKEALW